MEALNNALAAVQPKIARHEKELYDTQLVSAQTFVKIASSKDKKKLLEWGFTVTEAERCVDIHSASSSGRY